VAGIAGLPGAEKRYIKFTAATGRNLRGQICRLPQSP
jgi:hypothetical protein